MKQNHPKRLLAGIMAFVLISLAIILVTFALRALHIK